MCVGLIIFQGECFLVLKYKWPNGKEILMKIKIEPEHGSYWEGLQGNVLLTAQRYCLWACEFPLPCLIVQLFKKNSRIFIQIFTCEFTETEWLGLEGPLKIT